MRTAIVILGGLLLFSLGTPRGGSAQSGYELFQQALVKERASGSLPDAILLYQRIVREHAADRELAARALLQMGLAYEKLGSPDARAAYQRVLREYGEQREEAAAAGLRLRGLREASPAGITLRRMATGPELDGVFNALSPDGRHLTFVDWETGNLAVKDLQTGERRRLTNSGYPDLAFYSAFSRDGRQVAYTWFPGDTAAELRVLPLEGGEPRVLLRVPKVGYVQPTDWSPDGEQIVAILQREAVGNQIVLIPADGGPARVLKSLEWRYPGRVTFRPDGRYLAYDVQANEEAPQRDVFLLATDGSQEVRLVTGPAHDIVLGWTPDGGALLVSSDRTGTAGAWLIPVDERGRAGPAGLARAEMGAVSPLSFTAAGAFYYVSSTYMQDVHTAPFDAARGELAGQATQLTQRFAGSHSGPEWSPDGRWLAYRRGRADGDAELVLRAEETGEERVVAMEVKSFHVRGPRWSPDGRSLLFFGRDGKGRWGLYTVALETGAAAFLQVPGDGGYVAQPQWAQDGKAVYYIREDQIRVLALASGRERALVGLHQLQGGSGLDVSPDGRWLAYTTQDSTTKAVTLRVMPAAGGESRELVRVPSPQEIYSPVWTPDGRYLLFTKTRTRLGLGRPGRMRELWRLDVSGGEAESLGLELEGLQHIAVRPDGQGIAFATLSGESELWVLERFLPTPPPTPGR